MINILSGLHYKHDPLYILSAMFVCAIGAWLASDLYYKVTARQDLVKKAILSLLAGMIAGSTIWTTHFVAMLGVEFPFPHTYDPANTLISLCLAIVLSSVGFLVAGIGGFPFSRLIGGTVIGSGIAAMHYDGLSALTFDGGRNYDWMTVAVSCASGLVFSILAIGLPSILPNRYPRLATALLFMAAIVTLHFIGMASLTLRPFGGSSLVGLEFRHILVLSVLLMMGMIMTFGAAAAVLDTRHLTTRLADMEHRAYHDPLTGLPNRALLDEKLSAQLAALTPSLKLVVVYFDLTRFKDINDVHGHEAGDSVLCTIAGRLAQTVRLGEFVSRIGGDEFIAYKSGIAGRDDADAFVARLRAAAVVSDIEYDGKYLGVGSSVGVCIAPDDGNEAKELLIKADLAMYRAKRDHIDIAMFYDFGIDEENRNRSALAIDLRRAVDNEEFELVYQRQNDVATGGVVGYEVLIRWYHPERGQIPPSVFVSIAEGDGLINEIGEWVLRTACFEAASWQTPKKIAVNVAARQLGDDNFPDVVRSALDNSGLKSSLLELEITESGIVVDAEQARKIVHKLKSIGVSIAMDDFGTGYSSLSTLQAFPIDKIKIDRTFVLNLKTSAQSQAIVRSTIALGHELNIEVLAEGVETVEDLDFLRSEGCSQVQGFLFGKPMPSEMLEPKKTGFGADSFPGAKKRDAHLLPVNETREQAAGSDR